MAHAPKYKSHLDTDPDLSSHNIITHKAQAQLHVLPRTVVAIPEPYTVYSEEHTQKVK